MNRVKRVGRATGCQLRAGDSVTIDPVVLVTVAVTDEGGEWAVWPLQKSFCPDAGPSEVVDAVRLLAEWLDSQADDMEAVLDGL